MLEKRLLKEMTHTFKYRKPENTIMSQQILYHNITATIHMNPSIMDTLAIMS
jgi:hypothetical protein